MEFQHYTFSGLTVLDSKQTWILIRLSFLVAFRKDKCDTLIMYEALHPWTFSSGTQGKEAED